MDEQLHGDICPLRLTMDMVGGKWRLSIICLLKDGTPKRYNQIRRGIPGITNVMLSQSLKHLEEYGIVHREQYNEVPVPGGVPADGERKVAADRAGTADGLGQSLYGGACAAALTL